MIGAIVLITSGLLVLVVGHIPLQTVSRPDRDPRAAIVAWILTLVSASGSIAIGVTMLVLPTHAGAPGLLGMVGSCLMHLGHEGLPNYEETVGILGVVAAGLAVVRVTIVAVRLGRARRRKRSHHRFLIGLIPHDRDNQDGLVWLENDALLAYSVSGRPGLVIASSAVRERLAPDALTATLEHERAHLRGHHHLLLAVADTLAIALPFPLLRQAPVSLRALVEYAADTAAAERCGPLAVRSALLSFAGSPVPHHGLAMTGATIISRLDRLETAGASSTPRRAVTCGITGAAAALVPMAVSAAAFLVVACPVG